MISMAEAVLDRKSTYTLDELEPRLRALVEQVRSGKAVLITDGEEPAAVLIDAGEYEKQQHKMWLMEKILLAEDDVRAGRVYTQEEVEAITESWFKDIPEP
jgi:prevent-host-death family protein